MEENKKPFYKNPAFPVTIICFFVAVGFVLLVMNKLGMLGASKIKFRAGDEYVSTRILYSYPAAADIEEGSITLKITKNELTVREDNFGTQDETIFEMDSWKWEDFPFTISEWNQMINEDSDEYVVFGNYDSTIDHKLSKYLPIDEDNYFLQMDEDLWLVTSGATEEGTAAILSITEFEKVDPEY